MIRRPLFWFLYKNIGYVIFNFLQQKKLIFNFFVNRNCKKLTDSRKRAKILADNRKSHHPIETLYFRSSRLSTRCFSDGEKRRPEIRLCSQAIVTQEIVSAQLSP